MQTDIPKQGPMYFPMDRVGTTGDDPVFLLNQQNGNSTSNLINTPNNSSNSVGYPNSATGNPKNDKKNSTRLGRIMAVMLIIVSFIMFIVGIINFIFTNSSFSELKADKTSGAGLDVLRHPDIFIWIWASPGVWVSIPPFIAGIALLLSKRTPKKLSSSDYNPGLPIELQNSEANYSNAPDSYRIFAVFSITFCLPVGIVLAILDILVSLGTNTEKIVLPVLVAIIAAIDFVFLMVAWYGDKSASDNEYQYIGSTYTIYESYEPLLGKQPPIINTVGTTPIITTNQQCCPKESSTPIVIINQPPVAQPIAAPINVLVQERNPPPRRIISRPRPLPEPVAVPVPVPVPAFPGPRPMLPLFNQQRYYPNQMYGPPPTGIMGRPNAYRNMFLPPSGQSSFPYGQYGRP